MSKKSNFSDIVCSVKVQLIDIKDEKGQDEKVCKCMNLLDYLTNCGLPEIQQVLEIFSNALLDDCANEKCMIDVKKYFTLLFPTLNYSIVHVKRKPKLIVPTQDNVVATNVVATNVVATNAVMTTENKSPNKSSSSSEDLQKIMDNVLFGEIKDVVTNNDGVVEDEFIKNTVVRNPMFVGAIGGTNVMLGAGVSNPMFVGATGPTKAVDKIEDASELIDMKTIWTNPKFTEASKASSPNAYTKMHDNLDAYTQQYATRCENKQKKQTPKTIPKTTKRLQPTQVPVPKPVPVPVPKPNPVSVPVPVPQSFTKSQLQLQSQSNSPPQALHTIVSPEILGQQLINLKKINKDHNNQSDKNKINVVDNYYETHKMFETHKMPETKPIELPAICESNVVSVVFYDIQKQIFTKVNYNIDLESSIITDLCIQYKMIDKKTTIPILPELNRTLDSIKNDLEFPEGPFIVKTNNTLYDVYEKKVQTETIKGYLYNSYITTTAVNHVGKYGILLI